MLDLEVVPERSLGNEQWEFTLGEWSVYPRDPRLWSLLPSRPFPPLVSAPYSPAPAAPGLFRPLGYPGSRH